MTDIAEQNLQICRRRWPTLAAQIAAAAPPQDLAWEGPEESPALAVSGYRLWSAYDSEAEARLQATMIPEDREQAWVYGVGSGDLIRELLKRPAIKQVNVVPLNLGVLHLLLHALDNREWLSDPRIQLYDPFGQTEVYEAFAAIPPCLSLCDPALTGLRDQINDALIKPFERERQQRRESMRLRQMEQNIDLIRSDGDVGSLFDTRPDSTAFVAMAGPTLADTAPWILEHRDEGLLIAVDGALTPLLNVGLVPDYVLSLDDNRKTIIRYFSGDLSPCTNSALIYTPIVHHDVLTRWPGPRLTMYTCETVYDQLRSRHPRGELFVAGSVAHPAVDLSVRMGTNTVMMFGADFGFPDGHIHANDNAPIDFYTNAAMAGITAINGHGQQIPTMLSFNGYRLGLEKLIARHPRVKFVNMSREGARIQGTQYPDGSTA